MSVYFDSRSNRYHARRYTEGRMHHIGRFDTREEAEIADRAWEGPKPTVEEEVIKRMFNNDISDVRPFAGWSKSDYYRKSREQVKELSKKYGYIRSGTST